MEARRVGSQKCRACCPSPAPNFDLFFSLWGSSRGITAAAKVRVWASLGSFCASPGGLQAAPFFPFFLPFPLLLLSLAFALTGLAFVPQLVWTIFGGALAEIDEHVEGHRDDSATILDLALTSLRFEAGLLRNISTELHHVLIMLTRGRTQRSVKRQSRNGWNRIDIFSDGMNQFRRSRKFRNLSICWQPRSVTISWTL